MTSERSDRLYELLPAVYRVRDADLGLPLQALSRVIGEQINLVERDIWQLYDNWFIETCEPWVVPYLGELVGLTRHELRAQDLNETAVRRALRERVLAPRREVAKAAGHHRRKGTLSVLEDLAEDVSGWLAHAVEQFPIVLQTPSLPCASCPKSNCAEPNAPPPIGHLPSLRNREQLANRNTPFDTITRTASLRRSDDFAQPASKNVALFVWQHKAQRLTKVVACKPQKCEDEHDHPPYFLLNPLGMDVPLCVNPAKESDALGISQPLHVPTRITVEMLAADLARSDGPQLYGEGKSLALYAPLGDGRCGYVRPDDVMSLSISDVTEQHAIHGKKWLLDPERGRLIAPSDKFHSVLSTYHYPALSDLGGGEYDRELVPTDSRSTTVHRIRSVDGWSVEKDCIAYKLNLCCYLPLLESPEFDQRVSCRNQGCPSPPKDRYFVIEICDSGTYELCPDESPQCRSDTLTSICTSIPDHTHLVIRGARGCRPVLYLPPHHGWSVKLGQGSGLTLDGVILAGRCNSHLRIEGLSEATKGAAARVDSASPCCGSKVTGDPLPRRHVTIRHATFLPSKGRRVVLELKGIETCVTIDHSVIAPVHGSAPRKNQNERDQSQSQIDCQACDVPAGAGRVTMLVRDSIVDGRDLVAVKAKHAVSLEVHRSTILGAVYVRELMRAQDSLFRNLVSVERKQEGGMRFCFVPANDPANRIWKTPRQYYCQPALSQKRVQATSCAGPSDPSVCDSYDAPVQIKTPAADIVPHFVSNRYGHPGYCQLSRNTPREIREGAEDESEVGVYHDLYHSQREANLRMRLENFAPAAMQIQLLFTDEHFPEISR